MKKTTIVFVTLAFSFAMDGIGQTPTPAPKAKKGETTAQVATATTTPAPKSRERAKASPTATPQVTPAPKPKRKFFWHWLFFRKAKPEENATHAATATPSATPAKAKAPGRPEIRGATPKPQASVSANSESAPPATATTPAPETTPGPSRISTSEENLTESVPFVPDAQGTAPGAPVIDEAKERQKYKEARTKALEDKSILALQEKADTARTDSQQRAALRAYYKALYAKMREVDPSLKDRIDRMEVATLRRLKGD